MIKLAGLLGASLSIIFFFVFIILGLMQPGYNHWNNTVSALAIGKYGWIQNLNFVILSFSFLFIGYGLNRQLSSKYNAVFFVFLMCSISSISIVFFPIKTDGLLEGMLQNLTGSDRIHYFMVLTMFCLSPIMLYPVLRSMWKNTNWHTFVPYTLAVLISNFTIGLLWFYMANEGLLVGYKGLVQKLLVVNVLIWMCITGIRLRKVTIIEV